MNEDEKRDKIPEVWEGHNIADFIDPDIMKVSVCFSHLHVHEGLRGFTLLRFCRHLCANEDTNCERFL